MTFTPRSSFYLIRYATPEAETKGGILIPEEYRVRANEGEVVAVGPGREIPALPGERTVMAAGVGDRVLYVPHDLQPHTEELALVADEDLLGVVDDETGDLLPANDWVTLSGVVRAAETKGGLAVPDRYQARVKKGRVKRVGPGIYQKRVHAILGLSEERELVGKLAWWDAGARMVEVKLPSGEMLLLVRAGELALLEED